MSETYDALRRLQSLIHAQASDGGPFWAVAHTYPGKIACIHAEVSRALEALRDPGNPVSDKIPPHHAVTEGLAGAVIRIFGLAGDMGVDLGPAIGAKLLAEAGEL